MLPSFALSKRIDRRPGLWRDSQKALSLVADEGRKGNITDAQAEALRWYLMAMYLSEIVLDEFVEETQQRLEDKFDDLLERITGLRWR